MIAPVVGLRRRSALLLLVSSLCSCISPQLSPGVDARPFVDKPLCTPSPIAQTLFVRGAMTTWALRDDLGFQYICDAYVLNVDLHGLYEFRITDAKFSGGLNFGAAPGSQELVQSMRWTPLSDGAKPGIPSLKFNFTGEHTMRLQVDAGGNAQLVIGPKTFANPANAAINDPIARSLAFDSRDLANKVPFGAVTSGNEIQFRLEAMSGASTVTLVIEKRRLEGPQEILKYDAVASVPLERNTQGERESWGGHYIFESIGVYGYYFLVDVHGKTYVYENNDDPIYWTRELGSNGKGRVSALLDPQRIRRFRQTVYRSDFRVPAWARDSVYYYIFPERFRNGDSGNDPRPGPRTFRDQSVEWHANWLELPYRPGSSDGSDNLYGNDFFGGDIAGIIAKLGYIRDLGANTLYLTPIFRAASNHKYDTADYRNIDPGFGSNDDFQRLTRAAGQRGMRVILDTSLNHSGSDSIYFDRYAKYAGLGAFHGGRIQPKSPYASWYRFDPDQTEPDKQYRGWAGAQDLPEFDKSSQSFRDFAFGASDSVMKLWLDRGASGWRMDVAPWIPDDFWREWRAAVKAHRPDALLIAESQFESSKFFLGDEFDATMNYVFRNSVQAYANGADARTIYRNIELMREAYPPQAFYALMNLLSTHDSARALYEFGYRDGNADVATIALAKQRLRLAAFFQMTFPGAPALFYGDEVGVTGGEDPYNRVTYPWPDQGGNPDMALLADYKALINLRNSQPVLRHGSIDAPAYLDDHVIALIRHDHSAWAITATNNDRVPHTVTLKLPPTLQQAGFRNALTQATVAAHEGMIAVDVPARYGTVLVNY